MTAKLVYIGVMLFLLATFYLAMKRIMRRDYYQNEERETEIINNQ